MKATLMIVLLLAVMGAGIYFWGGYQSFDPSQQGRDAKAAIRPGMPYKQVLDAAGDPQDYRVLLRRTRRVEGKEVAFVEPGPSSKFTRDGLDRRVAGGGCPEGFLFTYVFSNSVAFRVSFDDSGDVVAVEDATTMADLLQMKD